MKTDAELIAETVALINKIKRVRAGNHHKQAETSGTKNKAGLPKGSLVDANNVYRDANGVLQCPPRYAFGYKPEGGRIGTTAHGSVLHGQGRASHHHTR